MSDLSTRAVICTAHLLLAQNPKAVLRADADYMTFIALVRDWCETFTVKVNGKPVAVYWHPGNANRSAMQ